MPQDTFTPASVDDWEGIRNRGITPAVCSTVAGDTASRERFLKGAGLLGLNTARKPLHPQQLLLSDVLAGGFRQNAVMYPRRSSKTTSLIAEALGRAQAHDDYRVGILTMTTGKAGRERFRKDVVPVLERKYPDALTRPFKITRSAGMEGVRFNESGGMVAWLASIEDLRGEAFDLVILDEAGEPEPEKVQDALAAGLPTLDTRPGGQIVAAGTAGKYRGGNLLWDFLQGGHSGDGGIVEYSAPDTTSIEDIEEWDFVANLLLACHPGIGNLTTLESVRLNWKIMKPEVFLREYLSVFGIEGLSNRMIAPDLWAQRAQAGALPTPPDRFALALKVHRDQTAAALTAAWRDEKGKAHTVVLAHDRGVNWVNAKAYEIARKYSVPIVHDTQAADLVETEALAQKKPAPKFEPQTTRNVSTAAALLMKELENDRFVHHDQPDLNDAVELAVKRRILTAWGFGTADPAEDITTLEAAAMALRMYDQGRPRNQYQPS